MSLPNSYAHERSSSLAHSRRLLIPPEASWDTLLRAQIGLLQILLQGVLTGFSIGAGANAFCPALSSLRYVMSLGHSASSLGDSAPVPPAHLPPPTVLCPGYDISCSMQAAESNGILSEQCL